MLCSAEKSDAPDCGSWVRKSSTAGTTKPVSTRWSTMTWSSSGGFTSRTMTAQAPAPTTQVSQPQPPMW